MTADLRLFRRMRGLFWGMLVVGVVGITTVVVAIVTIPSALDMYSSATIRDFGGPMEVFRNGFGMLAALASLAAVLLGATAGSVDHQRGVLRDLVLAGRSRWQVVVGRVGAAALLLAAFVAVAACVVLAFGMVLPPIDGDVVWERVARDGLAYVPGILATLPFAAGVAMLVGSRGPAIGIYFVFALVVDNVLNAIPKVGAWWEHVSLTQAETQVQDWIRQGSGQEVPFGIVDRPDAQALAVLVTWSLGAFVLGIVRLTRRDL